MSINIDGKEYPLDPVLADKPLWEITLNGNPVGGVETLTAVNRQMGIGFLYGRSPAGPYNQGRLVNRGGAVIVPTVEVNGGTIYFLALQQVRLLIGPEPILEFPRGQALADEAAVETARRELLEETGLDMAEDALTYLGRGNPDSALIHGANVHCWWLRLPANYIVIENGIPRLRDGVKANPHSKLWENIRKSTFVCEDEFSSPSMMTSWAMGLVLQRIRRIEREARELLAPKP